MHSDDFSVQIIIRTNEENAFVEWLGIDQKKKKAE